MLQLQHAAKFYSTAFPIFTGFCLICKTIVNKQLSKTEVELPVADYENTAASHENNGYLRALGSNSKESGNNNAPSYVF